MAGDHYHGDVVHMNQTTNSVGIDKRTLVTGASGAELERALAELLPLLQDLHGRLQPLGARTVETAVAEIGESTDPAVRRGALERIGGILESAAPIGAPALALIQQILPMLGG
ncbi:hypothetical protein ACF065_26225 [Streptomyces sp. NPDC015232]|uniref:hypothetical protein n=1 Tax=unclassified Streptomyces TaxID=2593676 RepID=UPI0036FC5AD8